MKRYIFVLLFAFLLTACGQEADTDSTANMAGQSETVEREKAAADILTDETDTETSEEANTEAGGAAEETAENEASSDDLHELQVHFIDAGQADATLFQYGDGEEVYTILYDTGDWRGNDVVNYLAAQNISEIDLIIVSHPDADHIGQLAEIVAAYPVGEVWMSGNESSSDTFQEAIAAVLNSDSDYHEPRTGEEYEIGPMELKVLYPSSITGRSNEESVAVHFTYGDVRFLFTGDAEQAGEMEMLNSGVGVEADILQLGHHGSDTSSAPAFIEAVDPAIAIYSAGADNSYGHPSPEVVSRIQNSGIELYGTDVHGTIVVTTDGENYSIATKEDGTISPENTADAESEPENEEASSNANDTAEENSAADSCININEASPEELQEIIHIGPERAQDVISLRPFGSVDDLTRVDGIGPARIADITAEGLACTGG
ncbi:MBL fold metallo-hydrolase [Lentibacillus sediminis]|uniref:MBL fold metallo-hydrolase n=1 Tax=Lentibacillus sediminis TaxID=1940529 RepID=UPI001EFC43F0|nr:MBL fold metallo-hydrolase [Lentibacillus sediminis]